ncbi:DUF3850 domain-containing protein [Brytella acorum]|uniref:DUF3850 domain-containing protein n=1 Tax=Brytella acorum TaxID=2959299 RepID=A0AA35UGJ6_9PROT|nr:DUF3850 domain-containing protein [Brytella acorum]CAI9119571.1 DUF3850 domain-containing protein [Brytella acorum]
MSEKRRVHELKCKPEFFYELETRQKAAEIRLNDRGYQRGDVCIIRLYDEREPMFYRSIVRVITHVLHHQEFEGLAPNYVMLSFGAAL